MARVAWTQAGAGIQFFGSRELYQTFRDLPKDMQKKALRKATRDSAKIVLDEARKLVPEDEGHLKASLRVRVTRFTDKTGKTRRVKNVISHGVYTGEGFFKGDQYYGGFLEFGTKERFHKTTGKSVGKIDGTAHSYLRPALYSQPDRVLRKVRVSLARWTREAGNVRHPRRVNNSTAVKFTGV